MRLIKALCLAFVLAAFTPMVCVGEEGAAIEISALPTTVTSGFTQEAPGGEIISAKKIDGDVVTYRLVFKLNDKEHQITLTEDGVRARKKKDNGEKQ